MAKTLQEILALCQEKEIQMIDFKMTDIDGRWRHLSIVGRLNEDIPAVRHWGLTVPITAMLPLSAATMVFVPTWTPRQWTPLGRSHRDHDRGCDDSLPPRTVPLTSILGTWQRIHDYMKNWALPTRDCGTGVLNSMIFDLRGVLYPAGGFRVPGGHPVKPSGARGTTGIKSPGKPGTTLRYRKMSPRIAGRDRMLLEDWGIRVKYHHPEVGGCGQMEIEVELGEMTHMADSTMAAKYIVKNAAAREGRTATFLPKPVAGRPAVACMCICICSKTANPFSTMRRAMLNSAIPPCGSSGECWSMRPPSVPLPIPLPIPTNAWCLGSRHR